MVNLVRGRECFVVYLYYQFINKYFSIPPPPRLRDGVPGLPDLRRGYGHHQAHHQAGGEDRHPLLPGSGLLALRGGRPLLRGPAQHPRLVGVAGGPGRGHTRPGPAVLPRLRRPPGVPLPRLRCASVSDRHCVCRPGWYFDKTIILLG